MKNNNLSFLCNPLPHFSHCIYCCRLSLIRQHQFSFHIIESQSFVFYVNRLFYFFCPSPSFTSNRYLHQYSSSHSLTYSLPVLCFTFFLCAHEAAKLSKRHASLMLSWHIDDPLLHSSRCRNVGPVFLYSSAGTQTSSSGQLKINA